jgi:protein-tyrosine phosphatase
VPGNLPHPIALELASALNVDLSTHTASPVEPEGVAASDAIFVMDVPQLVEVQRRFPEARAKTFLLTCLAPDAPLEICDPYAGGESQFYACFGHISRAVRPIVNALAAASVHV